MCVCVCVYSTIVSKYCSLCVHVSLSKFQHIYVTVFWPRAVHIRTSGMCVCAYVISSYDLPTNVLINPLKSNDPYRGRTAQLTSKRWILYIYSTNIGTEYFKHGIYSPFFSSSKCSLFHNSNVFGSCIIHILYTGCAKIKKIPALKG